MTEWTFAMVDLAGYTALTETHGDEHAAELAVGFAALATTCLGPDDRLVKPIGDAVLLASPTPASGISLVTRLLTSASQLEGYPLARAGLHHGPAVERGGDMFGAAVNLAARVAGQASGGQTLVTGGVAKEAAGLGLDVAPIGTVTLRNVLEPVALYSLELGEERGAGDVDPVCRMWVSHNRAAGQLRHDGNLFWFCSLQCAAAFSTSPASYVEAL
jgi:adenylate cyclase